LSTWKAGTATSWLAVSAPPLSIWILAPVPETVHAATADIACPFWITNTSPAVKFAGAEPPPARTEFQLVVSVGARLPWE
jgi:hypothetical protein